MSSTARGLGYLAAGAGISAGVIYAVIGYLPAFTTAWASATAISFVVKLIFDKYSR